MRAFQPSIRIITLFHKTPLWNFNMSDIVLEQQTQLFLSRWPQPGGQTPSSLSSTELLGDADRAVPTLRKALQLLAPSHSSLYPSLSEHARYRAGEQGREMG